MTGRVQPRVPFAPLEDFLLGCDAHIIQFNGVASDHRVMAGAIAHRIGRPRRSVHRWRNQGHLPLHTADAIAIHLGSHPLAIWPEFYEGDTMNTNDDGLTFDQWMAKANAYCAKRCGVTLEDLPDGLHWDAWHDGEDFKVHVDELLEDEGFE